MKRKISTIVLFVLLILTVIALQKVDVPTSSQTTVGSATQAVARHAVN